MFVAEIAPQVDRLVWTVNYAAADLHTADEAFSEAGIDQIPFGRIANWVPMLRHGPVAEEILYRRYRYNPPAVVGGIIAVLSSTGCIERTDEGHLATERLVPVLDAISRALETVAHETWAGSEAKVAALSPLVRRVLDSAPSSPLLDAYRDAPEPESAPAQLHQRLAMLRLVRNEAHAAAWGARSLKPEDMVILSALWSGDISDTSQWTGPHEIVSDGRLTDAGRALRAEIEADTNRRNEPAFQALSPAERAVFLEAVTSLPGTPV